MANQKTTKNAGTDGNANSAISKLINETPELKAKLSDKVVLQFGQRFIVIDPNQPGLHVPSEGMYKDQVMQSYQPIAILDAKGNEFKPTPRGNRSKSTQG